MASPLVLSRLKLYRLLRVQPNVFLKKKSSKHQESFIRGQLRKLRMQSLNGAVRWEIFMAKTVAGIPLTQNSPLTAQVAAIRLRLTLGQPKAGPSIARTVSPK